MNRKKATLEAVIGEISNTPWNEMWCCVLHESNPKVQVEKVVLGVRNNDEDEDESFGSTPSTTSAPVTRYVFPKEFHVSPFMEMDYMYDWKFDVREDSCIDITNALIQYYNKPESNQGDTRMDEKTTTTRQFVARMRVHPHKTSKDNQEQEPISVVWSLAWQLSCYPVYCAIIQVWIHYQAFWLFYKGVPFQPHPQGSETPASRLIGNLMAPLFALQELLGQSKATTTTAATTGKEKSL